MFLQVCLLFRGYYLSPIFFLVFVVKGWEKLNGKKWGWEGKEGGRKWEKSSHKNPLPSKKKQKGG